MREWKQFIKKEHDKEYFKDLSSKLDREFEEFTIYPDKKNIYRAFELTPLMNVKCVIIGQDPYFNPGEAHGLSFSVQNGCRIPPSLRNIYKELNDDLKIIREGGDLTDWAKQGVLLLNRVLTVREGEPNSHKNIGWLEFTKSAVKEVSNRTEPVVFLLWGGEARKLRSLIDSRHLVLEAPHPSPLSSYRGFFGCKHFSKCNTFLKENGLDEIDWGRVING